MTQGWKLKAQGWEPENKKLRVTLDKLSLTHSKMGTVVGDILPRRYQEQWEGGVP